MIWWLSTLISKHHSMANSLADLHAKLVNALASLVQEGPLGGSSPTSPLPFRLPTSCPQASKPSTKLRSTWRFFGRSSMLLSRCTSPHLLRSRSHQWTVSSPAMKSSTKTSLLLCPLKTHWITTLLLTMPPTSVLHQMTAFHCPLHWVAIHLSVLTREQLYQLSTFQVSSPHYPRIQTTACMAHHLQTTTHLRIQTSFGSIITKMDMLRGLARICAKVPHHINLWLANKAYEPLDRMLVPVEGGSERPCFLHTLLMKNVPLPETMPSGGCLFEHQPPRCP